MLSFPIFLCCVALGIEHFLFSFLLPHSVSFSSLPPSTSSSLSFSPSPFPSRYALCIPPPPSHFPTGQHLSHSPPHPLINFSHIFSFSLLLFLPLILLPPHSLLPAPSSLQLMLVKISADSRSRGTPDSLPLPPSPLLSLSQTSHPCDLTDCLCSAPLFSSQAPAFQPAAANEPLCGQKRQQETEKEKKRERERGS